MEHSPPPIYLTEQEFSLRYHIGARTCSDGASPEMARCFAASGQGA